MAAKMLYTVVVADDEDELREAVCTMIPWRDYGFRLVGSASNGLDALQLVEQHEPDLLLTDIRMPFISGIELARQVRRCVRPPTLPSSAAMMILSTPSRRYNIILSAICSSL